jgi:hypothetical protein
MALGGDWPEDALDALNKLGRLPELPDVIKRAERLVFRHWHDMPRVAMALLKHGRLTGLYVVTLIEPRQ